MHPLLLYLILSNQLRLSFPSCICEGKLLNCLQKTDFIALGQHYTCLQLLDCVTKTFAMQSILGNFPCGHRERKTERTEGTARGIKSKCCTYKHTNDGKYEIKKQKRRMNSSDCMFITEGKGSYVMEKIVPLILKVTT